MDNAGSGGTEQVTGAGAGVTVHAAAERLGVSTRAIRARIRRGTLSAWKVTGSRGPEWRVNLEGAPAGNAERVDLHAASSTWAKERAVLLEQVAWLRGQVEVVNAQLAGVVRILEAEREQKAALEARPLRELPLEQSRRRWWWPF